MITPVGAPLEDVVGSAETSDEGGTHLKMELVAVPYNCIIGTDFIHSCIYIHKATILTAMYKGNVVFGSKSISNINEKTFSFQTSVTSKSRTATAN